MLDRDSDRFNTYVERSLLRKARQHKGTDLGGFLKCCRDHLVATQCCLNDAHEALDDHREKEEWMNNNFETIIRKACVAINCGTLPKNIATGLIAELQELLTKTYTQSAPHAWT